VAIMSQRAYARYRGVQVRAVQNAIEYARISTLPNGQIDSDVADDEWARNTMTKVPPPGRSGGDEDEPGHTLSANQYGKARAFREFYQARLAKLEYEEKVGTLIPKDEVKVAAFNKFRQYRDAMLNIPDRVAAMLAAEMEAAKCYEILASEIRKALNEFADSDD
jgi:hypothetical protein